MVSLGEGSTPLVHARRLGGSLGLRSLFLKIEGANPTGSFKDRGMVVAVAKALEDGARSVICASTGNTSASAAAYAAAAGLECVVVLPKGAIALGKLLQALVAGARVVAVDGNFDDALRIVRGLAEQDDHPVTLVNSVNPHRLEGQKTAAFEICDDLGDRRMSSPSRSATPGTSARTGVGSWNTRRPASSGHGRGCGASRRPAPRHSSMVSRWSGRTIATATGIGNPASWSKAIAARDGSGGRIDAVTDDEIIAAYRDLARLEGCSASRRRRRPWRGSRRRRAGASWTRPRRSYAC